LKIEMFSHFASRIEFGGTSPVGIPASDERTLFCYGACFHIGYKMLT
jgi:hypothetical protein